MAGPPIIQRPEGKAPTKTKNVWCPYCGVWTKFSRKRMGGYLDYSRTECCGITDKDFYIRKENHLWR